MVEFPKMFTNLWKVMQAFHGLTRRLQTTVEHMRVTNTTTAMVKGEVIALTAGARQAVRADAAAETTAWWVGVMTEPTAQDATGIARTNGYGYVLFETGLTLAANDPVYVSLTPGLATNVEPVDDYAARIGTIGDIGPYAADDAAWVFLQHCCFPAQVARS